MTEKHHKCIATFLFMQKTPHMHRIAFANTTAEWLPTPLELLPGDHSQFGYDEDRNRRLSSKHNVFKEPRATTYRMWHGDVRFAHFKSCVLGILVSRFCESEIIEHVLGFCRKTFTGSAASEYSSRIRRRTSPAFAGIGQDEGWKRRILLASLCWEGLICTTTSCSVVGVGLLAPSALKTWNILISSFCTKLSQLVIQVIQNQHNLKKPYVKHRESYLQSGEQPFVQGEQVSCNSTMLIYVVLINLSLCRFNLSPKMLWTQLNLDPDWNTVRREMDGFDGFTLEWLDPLQRSLAPDLATAECRAHSNIVQSCHSAQKIWQLSLTSDCFNANNFQTKTWILMACEHIWTNFETFWPESLGKLGKLGLGKAWRLEGLKNSGWVLARPRGCACLVLRWSPHLGMGDLHRTSWRSAPRRSHTKPYEAIRSVAAIRNHCVRCGACPVNSKHINTWTIHYSITFSDPNMHCTLIVIHGGGTYDVPLYVRMYIWCMILYLYIYIVFVFICIL